MRNLLPLITLVFIAMSLIASKYLFDSLLNLPNFENSKIFKVDLLTDKDFYKFGETALIKVIVFSSEPAKANLTLLFNGSAFRKSVSLEEGINEFEFEYSIPKCNSCNFSKPVKYEISAIVSHGKFAANKSREVLVG